MKSARMFILLFVLTAFVVPSAQAQWAVFDSTNYANAVNEYKQLQQMYTTANQTRDQIIQAYNLAYQMSRMPQNLYQRYKADFAQWTNLSAPNTYGNTSDWIDALNFGSVSRASTAYNNAVIPLLSYPSTYLTAQDTATQNAIKNQYATSELGQATLTSALSTLGTIRSNSEAFAQKLANLESDTFSTDPSQQTEMAVLGKMNTAAVLQIRSQQDANQILAVSAEQQALVAKQRIDERNRLINQAIYFQQNFSSTMQNVTGGVSNAIRAISLRTSGR
jgi:hypothetical protein